MIKAFDNFFSNSGSKSFWGTKSLQGTEDNKRIRISMSMNCRITHILAVFFPSLPPYPSSSHCTTWSLLSKKESPSWGCFNDIWCARFKCLLPSTLAQRLVLAGIYFQACKNKFKITWEGLKTEEAEVIQALTLKTLWSTLIFTGEERLKHEC